MSIEEKAYQSTPHNELIAQIMSEMTPKTEREHAAKREIQRLREAIEQAKKQEPVAYWHRDSNLNPEEYDGMLYFPDDCEGHCANCIPLYTAPPQREWVGLTDAERELAAWSSSNFLKMAESIEAKLKEKNAPNL